MVFCGGWQKRYELRQLRDSGIRIKGDERILGSSDFVEDVLKQAKEELSEKYRLQASGFDIDALISRVATYYKIAPEDLKTASTKATISKARTVLCYMAVRKLMISCADVARKMKISPATVSRAVSRASSIEDLNQLQELFLGDV
jgi:chromosomal replication initiation ATPase DnaA